MQNSNLPKNQDEKLDEIAELLTAILSYNRLTKKSILSHFVLGIATGLGATVGLAVVVAILGLILKWFGALPIIGLWFSNTAQYLPK